VDERRSCAIVLCDFLTSDGVMRRFGVDAQALNSLGPEVIAVDTWGHANNLRNIDVFIGGSIVVRDWISQLPCLKPSPFLPPDGSVGNCSFIDGAAPVSKSVRQHVRSGLGLVPTQKVVLLCTARWQQTAYANAHGDRTAVAFADLLATYLEELPESVVLLHVGPERMPALARLGPRYRWLPPLGSKFDLAMNSADLLLSTNASASTVSRSIFSKLPVIVLQNSCKADSLEEALAWLGSRRTEAVEKWLGTALPIYPFSLWPIGFFNLMSPLIRSNPYWEALEPVEWLDKTAFQSSMTGLLFDQARGDRLRERQEYFCRRVSELPTAASALVSLMGESLCAA